MQDFLQVCPMSQKETDANMQKNETIKNKKSRELYCMLLAAFKYHRHMVAQPCVNGDQLSQWRMAKFDLAQI